MMLNYNILFFVTFILINTNNNKYLKSFKFLNIYLNLLDQFDLYYNLLKLIIFYQKNL